MRRGTLRVAMTVLAVLALGACTGGEPGDPRTFPPYTAPASPTPTPTPTPTPDAATPPERPDMSTVDAETAEAVAVYFLQLYPYAYTSGDLTDLRALSHPECSFCTSVLEGVQQGVDGAYVVRGGQFVTSDFTTVQVSASYFDVELTADQAASTVYSSDGTVAAEYEAKTYRMAIGVLHEGDTWLIRGVDTTVGQVDAAVGQ